jgi:DNA mismatch endonuclease (patch repair protein)
MMSLIRAKNTKPELIVFEALSARSVSFHRHYDGAPGKPDIAKPKRKLAVFIDGDFWHGRHIDRIIEKHGIVSPWALKLQRNIDRDREQENALVALGWRVLRVWESDVTRVRTRDSTIDRICDFLRSPKR